MWLGMATAALLGGILAYFSFFHGEALSGLFIKGNETAVLSASAEYWNPGKTRFWIDEGVPLVIDRREGYHLHDVAGHTLIDVHLNGGTYNLGHRNPEVVGAVLETAAAIARAAS